MGTWYYLLSQLPSFSVTSERAPLPVTEKYFLELCSRFLDAKSMKILESVSLEPPRNGRKTGSAFLDAWYETERELRCALARIRALKLKKEFDMSDVSVPPDIAQIARTACGMDSPLAAEQYLNEVRINMIDRFAPLDAFSTDAVYAYALKLKLALRMRSFSEEAGSASYRTIYDKILGESI
ncbi:DUF2764 family protein [Treponema brennaborense]|uniref:DUF2764 family protein n=1 Tax=Treponema brennaborense (strain DSM 12168 / CIP 105900 / DD5/3) TaxID=906968 RepID=F4LL15_TREBD|nr:DUF2764 family protein [Treponema brennaborense]AEE16612.1 hypothetical protein Trebr_1184 [Treponema brennaborense DSM 12168]